MGERVIEVAADGQLPRALSPSRAKDFETCQLQWWFAVAHGWRTPPNRYTVMGVVVHGAFEELFKADPAERTQTWGLELLAQSWLRETEDSANEAVIGDRELMSELRVESHEAFVGLWQLERPHLIEVEPEANEAWVEAQFGDATVAGKIDRYTSNGVLRITDYKTGKVPDHAYTEAYLFGLWTYAAIMLANDPSLQPEVELLYTRHGVRIRRPVLVDYARAHALRLRNIWRETHRVTTEHTVTARTSVLCNWCAFSSVCPMIKGPKVPTPGSDASDEQLTELGLLRRRVEVETALESFLDEGPNEETIT